jgi:hypothetical protein
MAPVTKWNQGGYPQRLYSSRIDAGATMLPKLPNRKKAASTPARIDPHGNLRIDLAFPRQSAAQKRLDGNVGQAGYFRPIERPGNEAYERSQLGNSDEQIDELRCQFRGRNTASKLGYRLFVFDPFRQDARGVVVAGTESLP